MLGIWGLTRGDLLPAAARRAVPWPPSLYTIPRSCRMMKTFLLVQTATPHPHLRPAGAKRAATCGIRTLGPQFGSDHPGNLRELITGQDERRRGNGRST